MAYRPSWAIEQPRASHSRTRCWCPIAPGPRFSGPRPPDRARNPRQPDRKPARRDRSRAAARSVQSAPPPRIDRDGRRAIPPPGRGRKTLSRDRGRDYDPGRRNSGSTPPPVFANLRHCVDRGTHRVSWGVGGIPGGRACNRVPARWRSGRVGAGGCPPVPRSLGGRGSARIRTHQRAPVARRRSQ